MTAIGNPAWTEQAPTQEDILKTDKRFKMPDNADSFFRSGPGGGIDWKAWDERKQTPSVYEPPQFEPGWLSLCWCINWWGQRSPLCYQPIVPCCCASCVYCCCVCNVSYLKLDNNPDAWMMKMLKTGTSAKCPEKAKGIWWMQDNIAAHEHLVTWHDAEWVTDTVALKEITYNWTRGPTIFGAFLMCFVQLNGNKIRLYMSPDGKWMCLAGSSGNPTWIYIPDEDETTSLPNGQPLQRDPKEMMRVQYNNDADPKSGKYYQYRVRRVAYLDDNGQLVKCKACSDPKETQSLRSSSVASFRRLASAQVQVLFLF